MAKNELLPFADGEDANVLPTAQWEALTDILENGFQSGIAKSEQVNRVLAQGAVASYVLGQLIVDQLNKDATLDKNTLYQNLVSALQENAKDACLPLIGGTMTGAILRSGVVAKAIDQTELAFFGGDSYINGATLVLYGKNGIDKGAFLLRSSDGTNFYDLHGENDGSLTWSGKKLLTSSTMMPDYSAEVVLTMPDATLRSWTATNDGFITVSIFGSNGGWCTLEIAGKTLINTTTAGVNAICCGSGLFSVRKGDVVKYKSYATLETYYPRFIKFYPCKGA